MLIKNAIVLIKHVLSVKQRIIQETKANNTWLFFKSTFISHTHTQMAISATPITANFDVENK